MARVRDTVVKRVGGEQAQLDLDCRDGMYGMGLTDCVRADLAQADAADLALLDQLGQCLDRDLDGDVEVAPRTFKDVDGLGTTQHLESLFDRRADTFRAAVGPRLYVEGAFDAEHDLAGILGILLEVVLDQMQRVCLRRAVVYALHASQPGASGWSLLDGPAGRMAIHGGAVLYPKAAPTPFQRLAPCSNAVFITFTAMG